MELTHNKKSPMNSMANIHALVQKGKGEAGILWILAGVSDSLASKQFTTNVFNIRFFTGQGMGGKKVYVICSISRKRSWTSLCLLSWTPSQGCQAK